MTLEEIEQRIRHIKDADGDDEAQHILEDDLYKDVLRAIACGAANAPKLAAAVLKADDLEFSRWCA
jgi:hypothetical protein